MSSQSKRQRTDDSPPRVRQSEFVCQICLDVARDAVESNCCHKLFCHACISHVVLACPTCRARPLKFSPVPSLRRIIGSFEVVCTNDGCGIITTRSSLKDHEAVCEFKEYICPIVGCNFKGLRANYLRHLFDGHSAEVMACVDKVHARGGASVAVVAPRDRAPFHIRRDVPQFVEAAASAAASAAFMNRGGATGSVEIAQAFGAIQGAFREFRERDRDLRDHVHQLRDRLNRGASTLAAMANRPPRYQRTGDGSPSMSLSDLEELDPRALRDLESQLAVQVEQGSAAANTVNEIPFPEDFVPLSGSSNGDDVTTDWTRTSPVVFHGHDPDDVYVLGSGRGPSTSNAWI